MKIDVPGKIEDPLGRCANDGLQVNEGHALDVRPKRPEGKGDCSGCAPRYAEGTLDAEHQQTILDLLGKRISAEVFVARFGIDPRTDRSYVPRALEQALVERSSDDVALLLLLAFHFQLSRSWAPLMARLLGEDWHRSHEDLASALQDLRDPVTVDALFEAAPRIHPYLDVDESRALAVKCLWALHDIGTERARQKLEVLSESPVQVIADNAKERLHDLLARRPGDPDEPYRLARNRHVRDD